MAYYAGLLIFVVCPAVLLLELLRCCYLEFRRDRIPILLYHRLVPRRAVRDGLIQNAEPIYTCYDDVFREQMKYLAGAGYVTLGMDDLTDVLSGKAEPPDRPVVITFDDGYLSNYTLAYPPLREFGLRATIFVAPRPNEYTRNIVRGVDGFLSPEQMRELDAHGVAIESHTLTHCVLSELPDSEAQHELTESRRVLEEILNRPVRHLAVPRSGYSRRVRRLAERAGYATVCCNNKGSANRLSSLFALPRIVIERDMTADEFARALRPGPAVILRLIGNIKRLPERLLGSSGAVSLRRRLYHGLFGGLFVTRRLKRMLAGAVVVYVLGCALFIRSLVRG